MPSPFGPQKDAHYMSLALAQARKAASCDEVPIGAILVSAEGDILGRGYNQVEKRHTQAAHAEIRALAQAGTKLGDWRMDGSWLYVTLEPCAMCMGMIVLSRCAGVVYGATSPLFGHHLVDNDSGLSLYKKDAICIVAGVEAEPAAHLLKAFFKAKREFKSGR